MKSKLIHQKRNLILVCFAIVILFIFNKDFAECSENLESPEEITEINSNRSIDGNEIGHDDNLSENTPTNIKGGTLKDKPLNNTVIDKDDNTSLTNSSDDDIDKNINIADNILSTLDNDNPILENNSENENESIINVNIENNLENDILDISDGDIYRDIGVVDENNEELLKEVENIDEKAITSIESEWEKEISNFEPAEMLTIELENQKEFLYDPITEIPSHIKLAFIVNDENAKIDFNIIDPNQKVIYSADSQDHLFHEFIADVKGEYIFVMDSRANRNKIKVTYAIHQGNSTNTHLSHENLQTTWEKINSINKSLKSSRFTASLLSKKYDSHFEYAQKHNRNITFMSLVETTFLILIFFFQLFYIKRLVSKIN